MYTTNYNIKVTLSWLNRASKFYITFLYAKYIRTKRKVFLLKKYVEKCTVMSAVKNKPWNYSTKI